MLDHACAHHTGLQETMAANQDQGVEQREAIMPVVDDTHHVGGRISKTAVATD